MTTGNNKAIYLLLADKIIDDVLMDKIPPDGRLPSIRDYAAEVQVNPNTMMRTYDYLSSLNIIYNRRGVGYFLASDARETASSIRRRQLFDNDLSDIFRQLRLLMVSPQELSSHYEAYLKEKKFNSEEKQ